MFDRAYGEQQLTFFNGFYSAYGYLPLVVTLQFDGDKEQYLLPCLLRPGTASSRCGTLAYWKRLLPLLRQYFPSAQIRTRMDAGFASANIYDWFEDHAIEYFIGFPMNSRVIEEADRLVGIVRRRAQRSGQSERAFADCTYRAKSWQYPRRMIIKGEVTVLRKGNIRDNPRFVATNSRLAPEAAYLTYTGRGEMENRIKEALLGLAIDRTSCTRFVANQFRVLLTSAAYALCPTLRTLARGTRWARAQITTLQTQVFKIGVAVYSSARRVLVAAPLAYPWQSDWIQLARACGAADG